MADQDTGYSGYGQNNPSPQKPQGSLGDWILPIILLFCFPPLGVLLIALKLFGGGQSRGRAVRGRHPYYTQQAGPAGAPAGARTAPAAGTRTFSEPASSPRFKKGKAADPLSALARKSKLLILVGDDQVVCQMAATDRRSRRYSGLKIRLKEGGTAK